MIDKRGLTLVEVIVSFSFIILFTGSLFTILGYISKNNSVNSKQLIMSDILHNKMEEVKIKMNEDINTIINENKEFTHIENTKKYFINSNVYEINNMNAFYKVNIEIKDESRKFKDNIVSYYFNLIGYAPQYYNEILISIEDLYGLDTINNND